MTKALQEKIGRLEAILRDLGSTAVALSGGVDSTLLVAEARRVLGREGVLAVTATGNLFVPGEADNARDLAARLDVPHVVIETEPLAIPEVAANPPDRCYHCKKAIFAEVQRIARQRGLAAACDGANADDPGEHRPGMRATAELGVRSPLKEAGLTKANVRARSRELGLVTADRPSMACLASRFPYGTPVTEASIRRVAAAETVVQELGFPGCRVRDHGTVARIEVAPSAIPQLVRHRAALVEALQALGYAYVTCDLEGYRSGAMDEVLE